VPHFSVLAREERLGDEAAAGQAEVGEGDADEDAAEPVGECACRLREQNAPPVCAELHAVPAPAAANPFDVARLSGVAQRIGCERDYTNVSW
jgi:hypothetical protein